MPIQRFGKLVAAAASGVTADETSTSQWLRLASSDAKRLAVSEGLHRISVYSTNTSIAAQSDVTWKFYASNQTTELQSGSVVDQDSTTQNELDPWSKIVYADQDGYLQFSILTYLNVPMYVHVESLPYKAGLVPNLVTYNSTQSFVVPENASKILIIGGGGGGGAAGTNQAGAGGGGSGYIQVYTSGFSAGQTLSLIAGAGAPFTEPGLNGGNGGTTTLSGFGSAAGGEGGYWKGRGGNGGSGGGGARHGGPAGVGGAGGSNGSAGQAYTTAGGSGSGVQAPVEFSPAPAAGPSNHYGGAGGGFYGGGAGGGASNSSPQSGRSGQAAVGMGGGGGGGGGGNNGSASYGGGAGGDGGAIILAGWA